MQIRPAVKDPTFSGKKKELKPRTVVLKFFFFFALFEMYGETEIQNRQRRESKELKREGGGGGRRRSVKLAMGLISINL